MVQKKLVPYCNQLWAMTTWKQNSTSNRKHRRMFINIHCDRSSEAVQGLKDPWSWSTHLNSNKKAMRKMSLKTTRITWSSTYRFLASGIFWKLFGKKGMTTSIPGRTSDVEGKIRPKEKLLGHNITTKTAPNRASSTWPLPHTPSRQ